MLETIKQVYDDNGTVYTTLKNKREFYNEQEKTIDSLDDLQAIKDLDSIAEELYNELHGHLGFVKDEYFYNYITYVCIYQINKGVAHNCVILEQDKEDLQMQSYITLRELLSSKIDKEYSFQDFNFICNRVVNRIMKKITYAFHRFEMDSSFNLTKEDENGAIVPMNIDEFIINRDTRTAKENTLSEKAFVRGIRSAELLEDLENCLSYAENEQLKKLLALKVDKIALSSTQRSQLNRISKKIQAYKIECDTKAKELRKDSKKAWQELLQAKQQEKKLQTQARKEAKEEYKQGKKMKADSTLNSLKESVLKRITGLKAKAVKLGYISTVQELLRIESLVNACPSQNALKDIRKLVNACDDELKGFTKEYAQHLKDLKAEAKKIMKTA